MDTLPIIALFEARAEMMDAIEQSADLEDALVKLATWLYESQDLLSDDDMTLLIEVGGILYREGLVRRLQQRPKDIGC